MTTSPLQGGSLPANLSNLPGMVPPAGETPNFDNPYSRGETFTAVATTITVVMIILVINREYTKYFIIRKLGWDDLTCLLGALAATGYYISSLYEVKAGRVGIHQWNVRLTYLMSDVFLVPSYVVVILVPPAMIFTKLTFFLVYLQIFQPFKWLRTCVYLGATVTTLFYVVTELFWIVAMTPIKAQTFLSVGASPAQLRALVLSVPTAAVGLGIDVYLLVLPVTAVMQLQLPTRHKIGVILIFLTGIAAVISSALSVYYRTLLNTDADITWNLLSVNVLSIAEMSIGLCCISMPALPKMLGHHLPYQKVKSWLHSRYNAAKFTVPNSSPSKSLRLRRDLLFKKRATSRSSDCYLDLDGSNVERLDQGASLSPYKTGPTKKAVRTFIGSGTHNVINDNGIHFEVELQQHSQQCDSV